MQVKVRTMPQPITDQVVLCVVALSKINWISKPLGTRASMVSKKAQNSVLRWPG